MASPEIQRQIRQHGADIDAVYELLAEHGEDLTAIKTTQAEQGDTLASHGRKLDQVLALLHRLTGTDPGQD